MIVDLDELAQLEKAATAGAWFVECCGIMNATRSYTVVPVGDSSQDEHDATFIVAARNALSDLIAELRLARSVVRTAYGWTAALEGGRQSGQPTGAYSSFRCALDEYMAHWWRHAPQTEAEPEAELTT